MKKQPNVTDNTKKAFINAFCELYCQKPIEKISVQEIANNAGYNRSSFYQHFCDIYELLDFIENDVLDSMHQKLNGGKGNVQEIMCLYNEKRLYLDALFGDYGGTRFLEKLKANVPFESHKLNIPKDDPITPYLMEFHLSTVLSLLRLWHRRKNDLPPEKLLDLAYRLYVGGISAILNENPPL
jgi:Transcriptional regulator